MKFHTPINLLPKNAPSPWVRRVVFGVYSLSSILMLALIWQLTPAGNLSAQIGDFFNGEPRTTPINTPTLQKMPRVVLAEELERIFPTQHASETVIRITNKKQEGFLFNTESNIRISLDASQAVSPVLPISASKAIQSPTGSRIAYTQTLGTYTEILIADIDGGNPYTLLRTRISNPTIAWPIESSLALHGGRIDGKGESLSLVAIADGKVTPLLVGQERLAFQWSHQGDKFVYSSFDASGIHLYLFDIPRRAYTQLAITTSAEKCAWTPDDTLLYCGVPTSSSFSADVPSAHTATNDMITIFSIDTGVSTTYFTPMDGRRFSIQSPVITKNALLFINAFDRYLYQLRLTH